MKGCFFVLAILFLFGCDQSAKKNTSQIFEGPISVGTIIGNRTREVSGMVASINNPGMFWIQTDSGNKPDIFLLDKSGAVRCTVHLADIKNRDWEDIAICTIDNKNYLLIAEIGDNNAVFDYKYIYRIEEPQLDSTQADTTITNIQTIKFKLEDGARDAEALTVDPLTNDVYVFSKREMNVNLYKLQYPQSLTEEATAKRVVQGLPFSMIVAADISKDGTEILVKNYQNVFYWKRGKEEALEDVINKTVEVLVYTPEPQGEAIAFDREGLGYYTLSEQRKKMPQHLYFYKRK